MSDTNIRTNADSSSLVRVKMPVDRVSHLPALSRLADYLCGVANLPQGGIVWLALNGGEGAALRDVRATWAQAAERAAARLTVPVAVRVSARLVGSFTEVEMRVAPVRPVGQLAAIVDGPAWRVEGLELVPAYPPLVRPPRARWGTAPMLRPVEGSSPLWFDAELAQRLIAPQPERWSENARHIGIVAGLLARDGVRMTRLGELLAGAEGRRPAGDAVWVETGACRTVLNHGLLKVGKQLRELLRVERVPRGDLVVALVLALLTRTRSAADPGSARPVVVVVERYAIAVFTHAPLCDDAVLARAMERWCPAAMAAAHGARADALVSWRGNARGVRVDITLDGSSRRAAPSALHGPASAPSPVMVSPDARGGTPLPGAQSAHPGAISAVSVGGTDRPTQAEPVGRTVAALPNVDEVFPGAAVERAPDSPMQPRVDRERAVLALLADRRDLSRGELDELLGWSRSTLRSVLAGLVERGELVAVASSARSPFQRYRRP